MTESVAKEALKLKFQQYYKKLDDKAMRGLIMDTQEDLLISNETM